MAVPELSRLGGDWSPGLVPAETEQPEPTLLPGPGITRLYPLVSTYYLSRIPKAGAKCRHAQPAPGSGDKQPGVR